MWVENISQLPPFQEEIVILLLEKGSFILESQGVGKYGRCLGIIFVNEVNVNKQLITEGHAVEYNGGKR